MEERIPRVQANLADIIFQMCVNFLMYTLLILVFYMLVRFYLEEDTTESNEDAGYSAVSVDDEELEDELNDNSAAPNSALSSPKASKKGGKKAQEIEMRSRLESTESLDERATGDVVGDLLEQGAGKNNKNKNEKEVNGMAPQSPPRLKKSNSFLNLNEWGEPEGTKEEVYQRVIFCAIGLNITFCIWGLVQVRTYGSTKQSIVYALYLILYNLYFIHNLSLVVHFTNTYRTPNLMYNNAQQQQQ